MKNKYVLFALSPLVILIDLLGFSYIAELVRQPSDVDVFTGVVLLCLLLAVNYFLVYFLIKFIGSKI